MRTVKRKLLASGGALALGLAPGLARAQADTHPPLPNVLLLVGNSGSMEYLMEPDPNPATNPRGIYLMTPESADASPGAACTGTAGQTTELNRWASLVTVLTGTIPQSSFSCQAMNRSTGAFVNEYQYTVGATNVNPYDYRYFLPFHRMFSNGCTVGPGVLDNAAQSNFWTQPAVPYTFHDASNNPCVWSGQASDGLLDAFSGLVRFGLMTYDTFPDPSTGVVGGGTSADPLGAIRGMWSYYNDWTQTTPVYPPPSTGTPMGGGPNVGPAAGYTVPSSNPIQPIYMEVGARNQAAPPWEGQLVPFGNPTDDSSVPATNANIQWELLALRPYGASPLAGMMDDAEQFLYRDVTLNPNTNQQFGPINDPYWQGGCRKTYIILISDGEPNMDLQTSDPANPMRLPVCDPNVAQQSCPYRTPAAIAGEMYNNMNPNLSVQTFVVGVTTSHPPAISPPGSPNYNATAYVNGIAFSSCNPNDVGGMNPMTDCDPMNYAGGVLPPSLAPCCALHTIALAGSHNTPAFFADNATQLKLTLAEILSQLVQSTTARTYPVYAPAGNQQAQAAAIAPVATYQFTSSFNVTAPPAMGNPNAVPAGMWTGNLARERTSCAGGMPTVQPISAGLGDDYAANVNMVGPQNPRQFFTAIGAPVNGNVNVVDSDYSLRPFLPADDGFGTYAPDPMAPTGPALLTDAAFPDAMAPYPAAFGISANQAVCTSAFGTNQAGPCTQAIINWEVGGDNPPPSGTQTLPTFSRDPAVCPAGQACSKLGAIFHSTPAVVGAPLESLIDDTYAAYALQSAKEPIMLYTATMDGQLHAFQVASNDTAQQANALDGQLQNNELWSFLPPHVLQHILPNYNIPGVALLDGAPVIADVPGQPYTPSMPAPIPVLTRVATPGTSATWHRVLLAGGGSAGGFYYALDITDPTQPEFLWQLSNDSAGYPMFGLTTPTPSIAIVAITIGGVLTQVPVAILPGGSGTSVPCGAGGPATSNVLSAMMVNGVPISIASPNDPSGENQNNLNGHNHVTASAKPLRCWDTSVNSSRASGNSLTIARLDTGQVLAHFIGSSTFGGNDYSGAPGPGGNSVASNSNKINNGYGNVFAAPFAAPLTGVPVAYPNQTGQVADRIYIGDADGLLWRIDLSKPDPSAWTAQIAWDAYMLAGDEGPAGGPTLREPSQLQPVVSRDPLGDVVVIYATGDQDTFTAQPSSIRLWSLTETPDPARLTGYVMSQNWWLPFSNQAVTNNNANCTPNLAGPASQPPSQCNRRITGPLALFNSIVYFATFTPQATGVCSDGFGSIWAVDYVRPDPANNGLPLAEFPTGTPVNALYQDGALGTVIYGTSVSQTASCDLQNNTMMGDPYFGTHNLVSNATQATYQLNWNAGAGAGLNAGARVKNDANNGYSRVNGSNVKVQQSMQIAGPGQSSRIDSWGAVIGQ